MISKAMREQRWDIAVKHLGPSLVGEDDGAPCIFTQTDDREVAYKRDGAEGDQLPRFLLLQSTTDLLCVYGADNPKQLVEVIKDLVLNAAVGEDYGWTLDKVIDLDLDKEIKYDVTVTLEA